MDFPAYRPRRLRRNEKIRELVRETTLSPKNFIYPIFVGPGKIGFNLCLQCPASRNSLWIAPL